MIAGIAEQVSLAGEVLLSPSADEVIVAVRDLLERGARLLVVCLRGSAVNPANEAAVGRIINASYPRHYLGAVPTLLSTDVSVIAGDADRMAAAVVNGYLHRRLATSLYKAEDDLRASGLARPLLIVTADGSVARVAKTRALATYQSGPAAGVHGAALLAQTYGLGCGADRRRGRDQHRLRPRPGRAAGAAAADRGGRAGDRAAIRRTALDRPGRRFRCRRRRGRGHRRAGQCRGRARARLLRPGRDRPDADRRVACPRLPGSGELSRRAAAAVPRPGGRGARARGRRAAGTVGGGSGAGHHRSGGAGSRQWRRRHAGPPGRPGSARRPVRGRPRAHLLRRRRRVPAARPSRREPGLARCTCRRSARSSPRSASAPSTSSIPTRHG